jgi:hypothetical protein
MATLERIFVPYGYPSALTQVCSSGLNLLVLRHFTHVNALELSHVSTLCMALGAGCREFKSLRPDQRYQWLTGFFL